MNRIQVVERLKLGRLVEAEAPRDEKNRRVFLEVRPQVDHARGTVISQGLVGEPYLLRNRPNEDIILSYEIRVCALNAGWEAEPDDWDHFAHTDERINCQSLDELEKVLLDRFGLRLENLTVPGATESPL